MAAYDGGHASKRQRTETNGFADGQRNREHHIDAPPSPVVFVRGLSDIVTQADLIGDLQRYGAISYVINLSRKHQAFVEFEDINGAMNLVNYSKNNPVYVANRPAQFAYSTNQKLDRQQGHGNNAAAAAKRGFNNEDNIDPASYLLDDFNRGNEERPNNVLLFTVLNPQYPITVDVMNTICSTNGKVLRIVIFKKQGVQAMVEMETPEAALRSKQNLNGCDIYSGCCTLKVEYARTNRLNVVRNDSESWDYTNPNLGQEPERRNAPLLPDPQMGGPRPYGQPDQHRDPYGEYNRGPPPPQQDRYPDRYGGPQGPPPQRGPDPYGPPANDPYRRGPGGPPGPDPYGRGPPPPNNDPYGHRPPQQGGPPGGPQGQYGAAAPTSGMLQQGSVLMVYGLTMDKMNCERVFNLFCLYGNVVRVKFLRSKEGSAMVQMGDPGAMDRAMKNLAGTVMFGNKLILGYSKQAYLQDVPNPHELPDGTKSFMDFMGTRNNRFTTPEAAAKNRIQPPGKTIYYWNAPPDFDEDKINNMFEELGVKVPDAIKVFPAKGDNKSSTGLLEWDDVSEAIEAIVVANHKQMENPKGKWPFVLKLCISGNAINKQLGGGHRQ